MLGFSEQIKVEEEGFEPTTNVSNQMCGAQQANTIALTTELIPPTTYTARLAGNSGFVAPFTAYIAAVSIASSAAT